MTYLRAYKQNPVATLIFVESMNQPEGVYFPSKENLSVSGRAHAVINRLLATYGGRGGSSSSLRLAVGYRHLRVVELLLTKGDEINAYTPLHRAVHQGHRDIVKLLLTKAADINAKNKWDRTPLDIDIARGHTEIVELLRKHGAEE